MTHSSAEALAFQGAILLAHVSLYFTEICRTPLDAPKTAIAMAMNTTPIAMNDEITAGVRQREKEGRARAGECTGRREDKSGRGQGAGGRGRGREEGRREKEQVV